MQQGSACAHASVLEQLGDGAVGEIIVHGPEVLQGYWTDANAGSFIERRRQALSAHRRWHSAGSEQPNEADKRAITNYAGRLKKWQLDAARI